MAGHNMERLRLRDGFPFESPSRPAPALCQGTDPDTTSVLSSRSPALSSGCFFGLPFPLCLAGDFRH
jgi:hypothetical protein